MTYRQSYYKVLQVHQLSEELKEHKLKECVLKQHSKCLLHKVASATRTPNKKQSLKQYTYESVDLNITKLFLNSYIF